jgi:hypothetical protein
MVVKRDAAVDPVLSAIDAEFTPDVSDCVTPPFTE